MESRQRTILILRWIQWTLGTFSFGILFAYFLTNINFYLFIPNLFRAQVALSGVLHIYLYLAAIWVSVKPQGPIVWAILDAIAAVLTAAVAGTSQSNLSTYCSSQPLTLYWSSAAFAYVPSNQLASNDKQDLLEIISSTYMQRACGLHAFVVALSVISLLLFATTAFLGTREHRHQREEEKAVYQRLSHHQQPYGWRRSVAPLRRKMNIDV